MIVIASCSLPDTVEKVVSAKGIRWTGNYFAYFRMVRKEDPLINRSMRRGTPQGGVISLLKDDRATAIGIVNDLTMLVRGNNANILNKFIEKALLTVKR